MLASPWATWQHCLACYANPQHLYSPVCHDRWRFTVRPSGYRGIHGAHSHHHQTQQLCTVLKVYNDSRGEPQRNSAVQRKARKRQTRRPPHCAPCAALSAPPPSIECPQHGPRSLPSLPSPSACLLHYLKHSLVFICRAGDVASRSTFPSRASLY